MSSETCQLFRYGFALSIRVIKGRPYKPKLRLGSNSSEQAGNDVGVDTSVAFNE